MTTATRLPAEWEPQDAILLSWPGADSDWAPYLTEIEQVFIQLVKQISRFEQLVIVAPEPETVRQTLHEAAVATDKVRFYAIANNDTWTRDCGPITVVHGQRPTLLDYGFNGWGLKFAADQDNQISRRLAQHGAFAAPLQTQGLILEGGSLESDGAGTLLTTSECLLGPNRNPHLSKPQLEQQLREQLGIKRILWLDHGYLAGDDTDSHIDTLARLCPQDTIIYVRCPDEQDEHYAALQRMEEQLHAFRTCQGTPYRLLPLPWPRPQFDAEGHRLPATYANFLIINGAVLVPTYDDPADSAALAVIAAAFPEREIIAINCNTVILQHGSLHCLTMQLPQGTLS